MPSPFRHQNFVLRLVDISSHSASDTFDWRRSDHGTDLRRGRAGNCWLDPRVSP